MTECTIVHASPRIACDTPRSRCCMHDRVYSEVLTGHYYRRARPERSARRSGNRPRRPSTNLAVPAGIDRSRRLCHGPCRQAASRSVVGLWPDWRRRSSSPQRAAPGHSHSVGAAAHNRAICVRARCPVGGTVAGGRAARWGPQLRWWPVWRRVGGPDACAAAAGGTGMLIRSAHDRERGCQVCGRRSRVRHRCRGGDRRRSGRFRGRRPAQRPGRQGDSGTAEPPPVVADAVRVRAIA